jgi:hypothetical protein
MVVHDQPFAVLRCVDERIASFHLFPGARLVSVNGKGVKTDIVGDVAANVDDTLVDLSLGGLLQKVNEVPAYRLGPDEWTVLHRRQQRCICGIIRNDRVKYGPLQTVVP